MEFKSQKGPSLGNDFNNRSEEAIGAAQDIWTAYREGEFAKNVRPWLGWLKLIEDCEASQTPVSVAEPHFTVFPELKNTSYMNRNRCELLLSKLLREKLYDSAALLSSKETGGKTGLYYKPSSDLRIKRLCASLAGDVLTVLASKP